MTKHPARSLKRLTQRPITPSRQGVSLIEMLIVISLISVIFTVAVLNLGFLMRVEMQGTARIQQILNQQIFSKQIREDVNNARRASIIAGDKETPDQLQLDFEPDYRILYDLDKNTHSIRRVKQEAGQITARDEFLADVSGFHIKEREAARGKMISLTVQFSPEVVHENPSLLKTSRSFLKIESAVSKKYSLLSRENAN